MSEAIEAAAEAVAAAKLQAEHGAATLEAAGAALDKVRARIADLDAERAQIVADRKAGKTSPKQGARLAEIGADIEGLNEILAEAVQARGIATAESARLSQSVAAAEYTLSNTADQALLGDLRRLASDLDRRLFGTIGEISSVAKRLGLNRAPWVPSAELGNGIRRLDIENGGLHR
jgi:chromosome segregation ATPase